MRLPLYSNLLAFLAFAALVVWLRYSVAMAERRVEQEEATRALNEGAPTPDSRASNSELKSQEVR